MATADRLKIDGRRVFVNVDGGGRIDMATANHVNRYLASLFPRANINFNYELARGFICFSGASNTGEKVDHRYIIKILKAHKCRLLVPPPHSPTASVDVRPKLLMLNLSAVLKAPDLVDDRFQVFVRTNASQMLEDYRSIFNAFAHYGDIIGISTLTRSGFFVRFLSSASVAALPRTLQVWDELNNGVYNLDIVRSPRQPAAVPTPARASSLTIDLDALFQCPSYTTTSFITSSSTPQQVDIKVTDDPVLAYEQVYVRVDADGTFRPLISNVAWDTRLGQQLYLCTLRMSGPDDVTSTFTNVTSTFTLVEDVYGRAAPRVLVLEHMQAFYHVLEVKLSHAMALRTLASYIVYQQHITSNTHVKTPILEVPWMTPVTPMPSSGRPA